MRQIMPNSLSDDRMFGFKPRDTSLQTRDFQAQKGTNAQCIFNTDPGN